MLFETRQKLEYSSDIVIQSHGQDIERVTSFCYLGVTLDEHLSWIGHVEIICNKVSKRLGLLSRIRPYLTQKAAKRVYNCLIEPIFNYTDTVWGGLSKGCSKNLQRLQNRAACIVQERSTTEEAFQMLGWINLETQRTMHKCILVYKGLNNLAAPYFCDYFKRKKNCIHSYNTRKKSDLHLPTPKFSLGKNTFRYSSLILFNKLPRTSKGATSLSKFKNLLKQYFTIWDIVYFISFLFYMIAVFYLVVVFQLLCSNH